MKLLMGLTSGEESESKPRSSSERPSPLKDDVAGVGGADGPSAPEMADGAEMGVGLVPWWDRTITPEPGSDDKRPMEDVRPDLPSLPLNDGRDAPSSASHAAVASAAFLVSSCDEPRALPLVMSLEHCLL